jgi:hypothetical protein
MTEPHDPTEACADVHCYFHGVDEPGTGYRTCLECKHLYRTVQELQAEWQANVPSPLPDISGPPPPEEIHFCPLCAHDF